MWQPQYARLSNAIRDAFQGLFVCETHTILHVSA